MNSTSSRNGSSAAIAPSPQFIRTWSAIVLSMCIFGVCLNGLVLLVMFRQRAYKSGSGILFMNLVLIYFVLSAVHYPLTAALVLLKWHGATFPPYTCFYQHVAWLVTQRVAVVLDFALAVNRLIAMMSPHHYRSWSRKSVTIPGCLLCYLVPMLPLLIAPPPGAMSVAGICSGPSTAKSLIADYVGSFGTTYLPMALALGCSMVMCVKLLAGRLRRSSAVVPLTASERVAARRLRITKMLMCSILLHFMSQIAQTVVQFGATWIYSYPWANPTLRSLHIVNSSFNGFTFFAVNVDYRKSAVEVWRRLLGKTARDESEESP